MNNSYAVQYIDEAKAIINQIDPLIIERIVGFFIALKERQGRLFVLGVGGGAANASHVVNDFRKIAGIEAYTPIDNVSELTARINDEGWECSFVNWLKGSRLTERDMVFVFSVGGGDEERRISINLVRALEYAKEAGATISGVVGKKGGYTARVADACVIVPTVNANTITAHTESFQALIAHLIVSHPKLRVNEMKWESIRER